MDLTWPRKYLKFWIRFTAAILVLALGFFFRSSPQSTGSQIISAIEASKTHSPDRSNASGHSTNHLDLAREHAKLCKDIYQVVCHKQGLHRDPTGSVRPDVEGEILALRNYQDIVHLHPNWSSEQVDQEFVDQIYTHKLRERIVGAYRWVRHTLILWINQQPDSVFNAHEKRVLRTRLRKTELDLPTRENPYKDEPDLLTKSDVLYEGLNSGRMRLRVGGAYPLAAKSWFNIVFTMAHELAHAIDPCEIRNEGLPFQSYRHLSTCFLQSGLIALRDTRMECGRNDQLSETFADWVAAQISGEALRTFSTEFKGPQLLAAVVNSVRDLCEEEDDWIEEDVELHPPARVRINGIFGRNPKVRELLGCTAIDEHEKPYCGF